MRLLGVMCALALAACSSSTPTVTPSPGVTSSKTASTTPSDAPRTTRSTPATTSTDGEPDPLPTKDGGAPGEQQAVDPPRAGTYTYKQSGETKAGLFTLEPDPEGTLAIDEPNGVRQRQNRTYSQNQSIEQVLEYRARGVYLVEYTSRFATESIECRLERPLLILKLPLKVGNTWKDQSTCDGLQMKVDGVVKATKRRTVGGQSVDTFHLKVVVDATGDGLQQTSVQNVWISPEHRLIVHLTERGEGTFGEQAFTSSRTDRLVSLQPS